MQTLDTRDPAFAAAWAALCARGSDEDERPVRDGRAAIVADVRARGDEALLEYTRRFDGWEPGGARRPRRSARRDLPPPGVAARGRAARRSPSPPAGSTPSTGASATPRCRPSATRPARRSPRWSARSPGSASTCPAARARYPSSVLMTAIPARVAGVREVVVCSPGVTGHRRGRRLDARRLPRLRRLPPLPGGRRAGGGGAGLRHRHGAGRRQDLRPRATPTWPPRSGSSSARWTST